MPQKVTREEIQQAFMGEMYKLWKKEMITKPKLVAFADFGQTFKYETKPEGKICYAYINPTLSKQSPKVRKQVEISDKLGERFSFLRSKQDAAFLRAAIEKEVLSHQRIQIPVYEQANNN
jgi:hypothetical protein